MSNMLRNVPSVSELLESPPLKSLVDRVSRNVVVSRARQFLDDMRSQVQTTASNVRIPAPSELAQRIADWIATDQQPLLTTVINATGIILHPELGGAPLADEAIQAMVTAASSCTNLEIDLATGEHCPRERAVEGLLTRLTGAEAATVVNSSAAATLMPLASLATGREVLVSRGQLLETDDGFRLPQIAMASGAILREVGTTNKTRIGDYAAAITPQSAALMRVHSSACAIVGYTEETSLAELVALGRRHNLIVIADIGSGSLMDLSRYSIHGELTASETIRAGADLVLFRGDRLLGGPQCGIIVGRRALIETITAHPRMRAVRVDKLRLAALAATLRLYQDLELAERSVPILSLLATPLDNLRQRADRLAPQIAATGVAKVEVQPGQTYVSDAPLPNHALPTICLALTPLGRTTEQLVADLRSGTPAVIGRAHEGSLLLDLRSVPPRADMQLVAAAEALRVGPVAEAPKLSPAID